MKKFYMYITIKEFIEIGGTMVKGKKVYERDGDSFKHVGFYKNFDSDGDMLHGYMDGIPIHLGRIKHYVKVEVKPSSMTIKDEVDPEHVKTVDIVCVPCPKCGSTNTAGIMNDEYSCLYCGHSPFKQLDIDDVMIGFWDNKDVGFRRLIITLYASNIPQNFPFDKKYHELSSDEKMWLNNALPVKVVYGRVSQVELKRLAIEKEVMKEGEHKSSWQSIEGISDGGIPVDALTGSKHDSNTHHGEVMGSLIKHIDWYNLKQVTEEAVRMVKRNNKIFIVAQHTKHRDYTIVDTNRWVHRMKDDPDYEAIVLLTKDKDYENALKTDVLIVEE